MEYDKYAKAVEEVGDLIDGWTNNTFDQAGCRIKKIWVHVYKKLLRENCSQDEISVNVDAGRYISNGGRSMAKSACGREGS